MRRNRFVVLIAGILTSALLSCSPADEQVTKEAALEIARKAFAAEHEQIREFKVSDSAPGSDDRYWQFFAEGTGDYARPGYHATIEVDKKTGQATIIMGE
jgi:hypothetical protein